MLKRFSDICASLVLLIILSPLFLLIAVFIKIDSAGPAFFRQERVGLHCSIFRIHKFRTMYYDEFNCGPEITVGDDVRITKFGSYLRRYKIDELPQLIDVLYGKMSLVGPRPEVPKYVKLYPDDIRSVVFSVRPGITDLASIEYIDENRILGLSACPNDAYINILLPRKLDLCVDYVKNQSLFLDIKILFVTVFKILF